MRVLNVSDIQHFSTGDGPGIRTTVFLKGCNLRCPWCHNPETISAAPQTLTFAHANRTQTYGHAMTAQQVLAQVLEDEDFYRASGGGVTFSGGEPLLQATFCEEFFRLAKECGLNTCLDTSGCVLNAEVEAVLDHCDRVLLDLKYVTEEKYRAHVGCGLDAPMRFLARLQERGIPVTLRQVTIPSLNDDEASVRELVRVAEAHPVVDKLELLPFRKVCQVKYDDMKLAFPFADIPAPDSASMEKLRALIPASLGGEAKACPKERAVHSELSSGKVKTGC